MSKRLLKKDFEEIFENLLSDYVADKINKYNFQYDELSFEEYNNALMSIIKSLFNPDLAKAGEQRLEVWEKGWGENLENLQQKKTVDAISPLYFGKFPVVRLKQRFIKTLTKEFEANSLFIIQDWLFDKYLRKYDHIYEFGCGTGHNLFRVRQVNQNAELWGLDWATSSQGIINELRNNGIDKKMFAHRFDYFNPDFEFDLGSNSAIYTVASLEQIGDKHTKFIEYLLKKKPDICIHIEPIGELLDPENLLDLLSIKYFEKRNYLKGYLDALRKLEQENKIEIIDARRSYIGSLFIDGYSVIVWKPKNN
jgi:hypothetical protein